MNDPIDAIRVDLIIVYFSKCVPDNCPTDGDDSNLV